MVTDKGDKGNNDLTCARSDEGDKSNGIGYH